MGRTLHEVVLPSPRHRREGPFELEVAVNVGDADAGQAAKHVLAGEAAQRVPVLPTMFVEVPHRHDRGQAVVTGGATDGSKPPGACTYRLGLSGRVRPRVMASLARASSARKSV